MKNPYTIRARMFSLFLGLGAIIVGAVPLIVGAALTLTVIGAPIGLPLMACCGIPLKWVVMRRIKRRLAWEDRDHVMSPDGPVPWFIDESPN